MKIVKVEDEYKKFKEMNRDEVLKIMEWMKQQPHLPRITEREVIMFYHACFYSVEMTKLTIDLYYTFRTHCPDFFTNLDVSSDELQRTMDTVTIITLKEKCTPEGYKVIIGRLNNYDASNFVFADCIKLYSMIFDLSLVQYGVFAGWHLVIDMKGCTLGHVARLGPLTMKKFLTYLQEAVPVRLKGFHFINIVPFMDKILALMKPFLKQELLNILYVHPTLNDFYKHVPKDILPKEYGGSSGTIEDLRKESYENLIDNRQYFLDEEVTRRVNEKQRLGKPKNASDLFGVEGNFKKLDID